MIGTRRSSANLPGAGTETAVTFAERLRKEIVGLDRVENATDLSLGVSMGISTFDRRNRGQQMVEQADEAMYLAKRAGGEWVAVYDREQGEAELTGSNPPTE